MTHILYVIFFLKHALGDFTLQTDYMLQKGKLNDWFLPLLSHCAVHAVFTFTILLVYTQNLKISFSLAMLDLFFHFIIDRVKAHPKLLGRFKILSGNEITFYMREIDTLKKIQPLEIFRVRELEKRIIESKFGWDALAVDQFLHYCTYAVIIYLVGGL